MNVNCPEFVPFSRRDTPNSNQTIQYFDDNENFQRSREFCQRSSSKNLNIQNVLHYQHQQIQQYHYHHHHHHQRQVSPTWLLGQIFVFPTAAPWQGRDIKFINGRGPNNEQQKSKSSNDLPANVTGGICSCSSSDDIGGSYHLKEKIKKTTKTERNHRRQRKFQHNIKDPIDDKENHKTSRNSKNNTSTTRKQSLSTSISTVVTIPLSSTNASQNNISEISTLMKISKKSLLINDDHFERNKLIKMLRNYIVDPYYLRIYGYPVESTTYLGKVEIFKYPTISHSPRPSSTLLSLSNSNSIIKCNSSQDIMSDDSGLGSSGSSSPLFIDNDTTQMIEEEQNDATLQVLRRLCPKLEKQCVRCCRSFFMTESGDYLTQEECTYHWGRSNQIYTGTNGLCNQYTCCNGNEKSQGCVKNRLHTWSGVSFGVNGPYDGYIRTQTKSKLNEKNLVYALDCEMCFTGFGLELTKISIINIDGELVYEKYVRPETEIVDYNTRFSGINEMDLNINNNNNIKTLSQVQKDLLKLFTSDTILIGHALENDLRVLKLIHKNIIDTSIVFPHSSGFPYKRALKTLAKIYLNRNIQTCDSGHSSLEDSRACLDLMLWKVREDLNTQPE